MHRSTVPALLLLSGCWLSNAEILDRYDGSVDSDSGDIDSGDIDSGDIDTGDIDTGDGAATSQIVSVEPAYGTDAGGQTVVITVDSVGANLSVSLGGAQASVVRSTGTTVTIETPVGSHGYQDVLVASGGGSATQSDGFYFWEDALGSYGAVGIISTNDYTGDLVRIGYTDDSTVAFQLVEPTDQGIDAAYGSTLDSCTSGFFSSDHQALDLGVAQIEIRDVEGTLEVDYNDDTDQYENTYVAGAVLPNSVYTLLNPDGQADFPTFGIDPLTRTPMAFSVTSPDLEADRGPTDAIGANVSASFPITWTGGSAADYVLLDMYRYVVPFGSITYEVVQHVRCKTTDDGLFQVPADAWSGWYLAAPIDLYVSRIRTQEDELVHNRSTNGVVGRYQVSGTVYQGL